MQSIFNLVLLAGHRVKYVVTMNDVKIGSMTLERKWLGGLMH